MLPIWLRPETATRSPRFTRDDIARAALEIADRHGFDEVSMRTIAKRLKAGTMSLYHYVKSKDDLVALMDDALMGEVLVPQGQLPTGWRAGLMAIAHRTRAVFVRHPWALTTLRSAPPGPNAMKHLDQCLEALNDAPFAPAARIGLLATVDDFVFGSAVRDSDGQTKGSKREQQKVNRAIREYAQRQIAAGGLKYTAALFAGIEDPEALFAPTPEQQRARFEAGLSALMDAAAAR